MLYCPFKMHCVIMLRNSHHHQRCQLASRTIRALKCLQVFPLVYQRLSTSLSWRSHMLEFTEIILKYSDMLHNVAQLLRSVF